MQPGAQDAAQNELTHEQHREQCRLAQPEAQPGQQGDTEQALRGRQQHLAHLTLVERQRCEVPRAR